MKKDFTKKELFDWLWEVYLSMWDKKKICEFFEIPVADFEKFCEKRMMEDFLRPKPKAFNETKVRYVKLHSPTEDERYTLNMRGIGE